MAQVQLDPKEWQQLSSLSGEVVLVGVRHHSPACAGHVREVIERLRPSAVLIEGPSEYTALENLQDPGLVAPVALFTYVAYPAREDDSEEESAGGESSAKVEAYGGESSAGEEKHSGESGGKRQAKEVSSRGGESDKEPPSREGSSVRKSASEARRQEGDSHSQEKAKGERDSRSQEKAKGEGDSRSQEKAKGEGDSRSQEKAKGEGDSHSQEKAGGGRQSAGRLLGRERYTGWYPLCDYSPELVAIRVAGRLGIPVSFCDLSLHGRVQFEQNLRERLQGEEHDLFEAHPATVSAYGEALRRKLRARDDDDLWDNLFEVGARPLEEFLQNIAAYGAALRASTPLEWIEGEGDPWREAFMAASIRRALVERGGPVVVVCGAFHLAGLRQALDENIPPPDVPPLPPDTHEGVHLIPYDFKRMTRLRYAAGMPMPEWYQAMWESKGRVPPWLHLLTRAARQARDKERLPISTAELESAAEMARRLALFRQHPVPSRVDVLDAIQTCWVKGARESGHGRILTLVREIFCGDRAGKVGPQAGDPPLVRDVDHLLVTHHLEDNNTLREISLSPLRSAGDRERARILLRLQYIGVDYGQLRKGPDLLEGTNLHRVGQVWQVHWTPEVRSQLYACSSYGATLADAAAEYLREQIDETPPRAGASVARLLEACALGLHQLIAPLLRILAARLDEDSLLLSVLQSLHGLVLLYRYRDVFDAVGLPSLGELIVRNGERSLWLLEDLPRLSSDQEEEAIQGLRALDHLAQTLGDLVAAGDLHQVLEDKREALRGVPGIHGAADGVLWRAALLDIEALGQALRAHFAEADREAGGRYLGGLLAIARRAYLDHLPLLAEVSAGLLSLDEEDFRRALPWLRRVHTSLTPAETDRLSRKIAEIWGGEAQDLHSPLPTSAEELSLLHQLDKESRQILSQWGLALLPEENSTEEVPDARSTVLRARKEGEKKTTEHTEHTEKKKKREEEGRGGGAPRRKKKDAKTSGGDSFSTGGLPLSATSPTTSLATPPAASSLSLLQGESREESEELLRRWRLVLGRYASSLPAPGARGCESSAGGEAKRGAGGEDAELERALAFLYDREYSGAEREQRGDLEEKGRRQGGSGPSVLTAPEWINKLERLFPRETYEKLEAEALHRYGLTELVTNAEVLERCQPSMALLEAVMRFQHRMEPRVLAVARRIVREVVEELREKLFREAQSALSGKIRHGQPIPRGHARSFDPETTIRRNLRHYDPERRILVLERPWFRRHIRQYTDWKVIVCVDQSGSMLSSTIHAGVVASVFASIRELQTRLVVFDTSVVDLSEVCQDPVETLLSVQLGGGTDIAQAVGYCQELVEQPARTIFVLITDLYEGGNEALLRERIQRLVESGVKVMILAALDEKGEPDYDRDLGRRLVRLGAHVGAMTPKQLVRWIGELLG